MQKRRAGAIARLLSAWFEVHQRPLPWRGTRDPYRILVSEVMLQQTQVATIAPRYRSFLRRFPTVQALAMAREGEVLKAWEGLGYYSRARNLHRAARAVSAHGGFPRSREGLAALPGVGPYTAGAVASIAFDLPEPALDGNAMRVLARLLGERSDVKSAHTRARLSSRLGAVLRSGSPRVLTQAIMELGALVCTPRKPACPACPLRGLCAARRLGIQGKLPRKARSPAPGTVRVAFARVRSRSRVLLVRRPERGLLAGQWQLPGVELRDGESPRAALARELRRIGVRARPGPRVERGVHAFSHVHWRYEVYEARATRVGGTAAGRWCTPAQARELPVITLHRRHLAPAEKDIQVYTSNTRGERTRSRRTAALPPRS